MDIAIVDRRWVEARKAHHMADSTCKAGCLSSSSVKLSLWDVTSMITFASYLLQFTVVL